MPVLLLNNCCLLPFACVMVGLAKAVGHHSLVVCFHNPHLYNRNVIHVKTHLADFLGG